MQLTVQDAFALAARHEAAGRVGPARAIYEQILAALPEHPGALLRIAEQELAAGDHQAARLRLERALTAAHAQALPTEEIWLALAHSHLALGDRVGARHAIGEGLIAPSSSVTTLVRLGSAADAAGDAVLAEHAFRIARERDPGRVAAAAGLAHSLALQRRFDEAQTMAQVALDLDPEAADSSRANAFVAFQRGEHALAQQLARQGLAQHPRDIGLMHLLGNALKAAGAAKAARSVLGECARLAPDDAGVRLSLGAACLDDGDAATAREHLESALAMGANSAELWDNLGLAYRALGHDENALHAFENAVATNPALTPALANLVYTRQYLCAWDGLEAHEQRLVATLSDAESDRRWSPFIALAMPLSAAQQLDVARRWSGVMLPSPVARRPAHERGVRLRVGYLSGSFHEHPTARLMVGLFEEHDRNRFEIIGYSYGPDDSSALRARVRAAFDAWRDVRHLSDADIARVIREDRIDVLVERKGHTLGGRLGILASRPAPVQVHYMSFPGTIGYDAIDGVIADAEVIPETDEAYFHERVWRLPRCYYVNDRKRALPPAASRSVHGLPDDALVLACLNQSYKLRPDIFSTWMEALRARPDAVLWLLTGHERAQANLREHASRTDVDPQRLIFARYIGQDEHIARLRCADLALDTLPYGAHTTGVDALWAGVPMLTCRGQTFAGRVGASLLIAAGLPELVTDAVADYQTRLLELIADGGALARYHDYLERTRETNPLFDTAGFTRDWEALLLRIYDESK